MIALFERFKLAIKYRAAGCPSPWRWAGTALRRDTTDRQSSRLWPDGVPSPKWPRKSPPPPPDLGQYDAIDRLEKTRQHWQRGYGCDKCQGTGWVAVTLKQVEKCQCVRGNVNPDPHPSMTRPNPPPRTP